MPAPVHVTDLAPWYDKGKGMGRRVHVDPKNWRKILKEFDMDKDGELSDAERTAWYKAIKDAEDANKKSGKKYGDFGYIWIPYALYDNPGYPFFIPGVSGHRPPHPPLDMAWKEEVRAKTDVQLEAGRPLNLDDRKSRWTDEKIRTELGLDPAKAAVKAK